MCDNQITHLPSSIRGLRLLESLLVEKNPLVAPPAAVRTACRCLCRCATGCRVCPLLCTVGRIGQVISSSAHDFLTRYFETSRLTMLCVCGVQVCSRGRVHMIRWLDQQAEVEFHEKQNPSHQKDVWDSQNSSPVPQRVTSNESDELGQTVSTSCFLRQLLLVAACCPLYVTYPPTYSLARSLSLSLSLSLSSPSLSTSASTAHRCPPFFWSLRIPLWRINYCLRSCVRVWRLVCPCLSP